MKKILISMIALLSIMMTARADGLVVANVGVQPGKTTEVQVALNNTGNSYRAVLFTLTLPEGISIGKDEFGEPVTIADPVLASAGYNISANVLSDGSVRFGVMNTGSDAPIPSACGTLFSFTIVAGESLSIGDVLTATLLDIKLTDASAVDHQVDNTTFRITVEEVRTILDETSTTAPEAAESVNVRVLRTINANEWSTICLPFAMTEAQVKTAFGDDVQLADFTSWSSEEDDDGNIVRINIGFTDVTDIEANHPYLIKVTEAISEFTADGVDIEVDEEPSVQVGKKKAERGYFIGCYAANTAIPENDLFLSGNKFSYSKGLTKMKAFRGFFELADVLTAVEGADSRISMSFDNQAEGIKETSNLKSQSSNLYDLQGRRVVKPGKGLYIQNGRKVIK